MTEINPIETLAHFCRELINSFQDENWVKFVKDKDQVIGATLSPTQFQEWIDSKFDEYITSNPEVFSDE